MSVKVIMKKLLIDLARFREGKDGRMNFGECVYDFHSDNKGIKALIEQAMLKFTCRRCEDAPCILVCPAEALEKDENGTLVRSSNLCIACKSCVVVSPFGTLMNEVFSAHKSVCDLCEFTEETQTLKCIETCPEGALQFVEFDENEKENIFKLNDKVLVKELLWEKLMRNE